MLKSTLRQHLPQESEQNDQGWFDCLGLCQEGDTIRVVFPHAYFAAWFSRHKQRLFEEALNRHFKGSALPRICYQKNRLADALPTSLLTQYSAPNDPSNDRDEDHFSSFLYNAKNAFPLAAAKEMASQKPGTVYNPFLLCGRSGTGKSLLLESIEKTFAGQMSPGRIIHQKALRFFQDRADSFARPELFWQEYTVLLLDDLQELTDHEDMQQKLIALMDACPRGNKDPTRQMIFAHAERSQSLKNLTERLYSRLESGLVLELLEPDIDIRLRYLQQLCKEKQLVLSREQLLFLVQRCTQFRLLQGLVLKLEAFASIRGKELSNTDLENIIRTGGVERLPGWKDILLQVAGSLNIRPDDILGTKRRTDLVLGRQMAMYLCRQRLGLSYPELGKAFGGRDHSTVIHAIKKIKKLMETDNTIYHLVTELENKSF